MSQVIELCVGILGDVAFLFLSLFITREWLGKVADIDMPTLVLYTVLMLVVGTCFGLLIGWTAMGRKLKSDAEDLKNTNARVAELEKLIEGKNKTIRREREKSTELAARLDRRKAEDEEQERIRKEESERKRRHDWVASLDANTKAMLFEIYNIEQVDLPFDSERRAREFSQSLSYMDESAVTCTHVGYDGDRLVYRVRLSDFGMHVVEECYDMLAEAEDFHGSHA